LSWRLLAVRFGSGVLGAVVFGLPGVVALAAAHGRLVDALARDVATALKPR